MQCGGCFDSISHEPAHAFVKFKRPVDNVSDVVSRVLLPHPPYDEQPLGGRRMF